MSVTNSYSLEGKEGKFKIYCFDNSVLEYNLSMYEYDSTWTNFLNCADLSKASLIISDIEIENYNWAKQEIKINETCIKKLEEFKIRNKYLSHLKFIVTFDNKRMYAGEFLSFMSAMAIKHPVIHYDIAPLTKAENIIRIYPAHTIWKLSDLPLEIRKRTEIEEV